MRTEQSIRPILICALGVAMLAGLDTLMKVVASTYPLGQVIGMRYASGAVFALAPMLVWREGWPTKATIKRTLLRAIVIVCTASAFFTALARLPLADAIALTFLAPLFMALLGRLILAEPITPATWLAIGLGFLGVVVIVHGQQVNPIRSLDPIGIAAGLACAFFYALAMVLMRRQTAADSIITIVGLSNLFTFILISPAMALQWQPPSQRDLAILAVAGFLGTLGHLCLAWAYKRAHAGRLGTLEYTAFLWGSAFGYLFFREIPTTWTVLGASLIVAACLCAAWLKSAQALPQTPEA